MRASARAPLPAINARSLPAARRAINPAPCPPSGLGWPEHPSINLNRFPRFLAHFDAFFNANPTVRFLS